MLAAALSAAALAVSGQSLGRPAGAVRVPVSERSAAASPTEARSSGSPTSTGTPSRGDDPPTASPPSPTSTSSGHGEPEGPDDRGDD